MTYPEHKIPPRGRGSSRWFLFLTFFHFLPFPWYMAVAAGLAPASFLFAGGLASLFSSDFDSLAFAAFLLVPALIAGIIYYLLSWLLAVLIGKFQNPVMRTASLLLALIACLIAAMNPIFISGGHGSSSAFSLFGFIDTLAEFRVPASLSIAYFSGLVFLLLCLLGYQHLVVRREALTVQRLQWQRRLRRRIVVGCLLTLVLAFCWTHRILIFLKPVADLGFAPAQYHLAMVIKEQSGSRFGSSGYQRYLVRAAEQGHLKAALELVLHPRSREEKLRWLKVAAEGGMAEAQYQFYQELLKSFPGIESSDSAYDWLKKAAKNNSADGQYELGRHYILGNTGLGIEKDVSKARQWWEEAVENGHGKAMIALARRYKMGAEGFPRDPQRAIELLNLIADAYQVGSNGLPQNQRVATSRRVAAEQLAAIEERLAQDDPQAQAQLGRELLKVRGATVETLAEAVALLEMAARQGDSQVQYELGNIFLNGRHGVEIDLERGRQWWAKALEQNHIKTMEYVAPAYQNGRFGYPVDLLKSKEIVQRLVDAYREGTDGVEANPRKERRWNSELKHFDRLFDLAGGNYQSPADLQPRAESGDAQAQYQLGRQMMISGPAAQRQQGIVLIERAAEGGYAEAQYRLVTYYERQAGIMRRNPQRGTGFLQAAAEQNHLPAMGALALGYEKGRYGLTRDYANAADWYQRIVEVYESGEYLGEIDERFMPFNRSRLIYAEKALKVEQEKAQRYAAASPQERQIIKVEERYLIRYQAAVNALPRGDGTAAGKIKFRAEIERLRKESHLLRDAEIELLKKGSL